MNHWFYSKKKHFSVSYKAGLRTIRIYGTIPIRSIKSIQSNLTLCRKTLIEGEVWSDHLLFTYEPRSDKTGLRGFRPGPTQTGLYSHRRWLEA